MPRPESQTGVTLVELVVTIAVLAILVALAAPSFRDFAERQALRGAADGIVNVVALAREEAAKRDQSVRVQFSVLGSAVCAGAAVGTAACDCSKGTCPIGASADRAADLQAISASLPTFGDDAGFIIDPKTGALLDFGDVGSFELTSKLGYVLQLNVGPMGRVTYCVPADKKQFAGVKPCA